MSEQEKYLPPEARQEVWDKLTLEVEQIADGLNHPVDKGIKDTIIAFKAYEIPTSGSCEGHTEENHGLPYPWVDIEVDEPKDWEEDEAKQKLWRNKNLLEQQKVINLLQEFYQDRNSPMEARLVFENFGIYGRFRIRSMGADVMDLLTEEELKAKSLLFQEEMKDFTEFLKNKFFTE